MGRGWELITLLYRFAVVGSSPRYVRGCVKPQSGRTIPSMADVTNPIRAKERLDRQIKRIGWLRGTGPNPIDYDEWDARTGELLSATYGDGSAEVERYGEAVGKRGRQPGVRGDADTMTLNIHGQWGILGRLERAEVLLAEYSAALG